jgi:hypothetical protein
LNGSYHADSVGRYRWVENGMGVLWPPEGIPESYRAATAECKRFKFSRMVLSMQCAKAASANSTNTNRSLESTEMACRNTRKLAPSWTLFRAFSAVTSHIFYQKNTYQGTSYCHCYSQRSNCSGSVVDFPYGVRKEVRAVSLQGRLRRRRDNHFRRCSGRDVAS